MYKMCPGRSMKTGERLRFPRSGVTHPPPNGPAETDLRSVTVAMQDDLRVAHPPGGNVCFPI